ncbi:MAG: fibronectin type III domain-containing protein [Bacteroidales bacterium]
MKNLLLYRSIAIAVFLSIGLLVNGQSTDGPNYPGTASSDASGDASWSNPDNTYADDANYAETVLSKGESSDYLIAENFGFAIPGTAVITGITVEINRQADNTIYDNALFLTKDGANDVGVDKAATGTGWPATEAVASYGGTADMWGTTWTPAEINSADFGVIFKVNADPGGSPHIDHIASVDYVRVSVTYTISCTAPTTQASNVNFTNNDNGTSLTANWTRGNGDNVLVVAREASTAAVAPSSGTTYTANTLYGSGNTTGTGNFVVYNGTGTSVDVTGLSPQTDYVFDVYEYLNTDVCYNTSANSGSVTTPALALEVPFTETFESGGGAWTYENGTETNEWVVGTATAATGSNSAYISDDGSTNNYSNTSSTTHMYIDLDFPASTDPFNLQFKWKGDGESTYDYMEVFLVSTSTTPVAGTELSSGQVGSTYNEQTTWQTENIELDAGTYANDTWRLVFTWDNDGLYDYQPPAAVDDIDISVISCAMPSGLSATDITDSQAELSWTDNAGASQWDIEYGASGFTQGDGTTVSGITDNPYTLSGLSANTDYDFYVRADCGGGDYSNWVGPYSFTTDCGVIIPPWLEDFSTYIPDCWSETTGTLAAPSTLTGTSSAWGEDGFANDGTTGAARVNIYSTGKDEWLISPSIDLGTGTTDYQLEFDLALTDYANAAPPDLDGTDDKFAVVISTDNGATWTSANTLQLWDNAGSSFVYNDISYTGEHVIIDLTGYTGTVKFGFYGESTVSNADNDLFVDNVEVIEIPSCPQPVSLNATNILPDEVDLGWTEFGSATQWDIEYGAAGFTQGDGTTVSGITDNPYTLSGLSATTDYDFYVRADCGGETSIWSGPYTFTTADPYMSYTSSTVTQTNTDPLNPGSVDQEIICVEVVTNDPTSPLDITQFNFNTTGSTDPGTDLENAKLYYTGTTGTFGTATQFGASEANPDGNYTITGTQALAEGTNYFWLAYDINNGATIDNYVDAQCTSITVDASAETPTETNPDGNRQILDVYFISESSQASTCTGVFYDSGGDAADYDYSEDYTRTFQAATPGSALEFDFTSFETGTNDDLTIYDGPDDTYPVIGVYDGTDSPGTITSNGAYLTFHFSSNSYTNAPGWAADISCVTITEPNCATLESPADGETDICPGTVMLNWQAPADGFAPEGYYLYLGTSIAADEVINGEDVGSSTSYELTNLEPNQTYYWKVLPYNGSGLNNTCGAYSFTTLDIGITSTNSPVETCDNTAGLTASGSGDIVWYSQPTGGSPIGSGSPYTANFSGNTTYYVAAQSNGLGTENGGMPANNSGEGFLGSSDEIGIVFDASQDFTLNSVDIYPVGTGTVTIALLNDAGNEVANSGSISIDNADGSAVTVDLGFGITVGSNYKLVLRDYTGITDLYRDFSGEYPYDSPSGALSVTGGWWDGSSTTNYYFYNLEISGGCVSAREAVEVIHTADPVSVTADGPTTFLEGGSVGLTASSDADPGYTYTWSPSTGLNTDTGDEVIASPSSTTTYTVTGEDGSGCAYTEEITITVTNPCAGLGTGYSQINNLPFSETSSTCGNADDITSNNATVCGSTDYYSGEDVVYSFTPNSDGLVNIDLTSSGSSTGIMLYEGCPMDDQGGTCVAYSQSSAGDESLCANLQMDNTYYLVIDSWSTPECNDFEINISAPDPNGISGDFPCDAVPVEIGGIQSGNNACASGMDEPSEASCWTSGNLNTLWYSFEAPASGSVNIRTILGTLTSTQIAAYQGNCSNLTMIANECNVDATGTCSGTEDFSELELTGLTEGNTYYIRVDGENDLTGSFEVQVIDGNDEWPVIPQQDCSSATNVCASETVVGDPGFLGAGSTCDFTTPYGCFSSGTQNNTVWYQIDIDANGELEYDIAPNLSTTDYDWALIDATNNTDVCDEIAAGTLEPVRCNFTATTGTTGLRDGYTETSIGASGDPFCSPLSVEAGDSYLLLIWNWSGNNTGFTLDFDDTSPIVIDDPESVTWSGGASTDWFDPVNWGGCAIPSCERDAIIVNGPTNQPVIGANTNAAECANITIESGASLSIDPGENLTVCENFNNSGALNADPTSTIVFDHASNSHEINGSLTGTNAMGNLSIDKAGGMVTFMQDIEIAGDLTTANATSVINTNGRTVTIGGDFTPFSGTFTGIGTTGKLRFNGSVQQSYNPGGDLELNDVTINNTAGGVLLNNTMEIGSTGVLSLNQGIIETDTYRVIVNNTDPAAVSEGNSGSYINTDLRRYLGSSGGYNFPLGTASAYRLLKLSNNGLAGVTYLDAEFLATFGDAGTLNSAQALDGSLIYQEVASEGIWNVVPDASPSGGSYDIRLYFDDGQGYQTDGTPIGDGFAGLIDNQFAVLKRPTGSTDAADWIGEPAGTIPADGSSGRLVDDGFAKRSDISDFSEFGIGKDNTVLPVELTRFEAACYDKNVELRWETASEINNDFFTILRSTDGDKFTPLTTVQGQGNSLQTHEYLFVDENPPAERMYYKLKQTDFDGKSSWSDVVFVSCAQDMGEFYISPNPFKEQLYIVFDEPTEQQYKVEIRDMLGKTLFEKNIPLNSLRINIDEAKKFVPGSYYLKITSDKESKTQKVIKL